MKRTAAWWQRSAIYQIYPLSFQDSAGDGKGDLAGILSRLEYLAWLGVGAVWLGPVYPSPMMDFGYDIADFTRVDSSFGSLSTLDQLIAALHSCGIRVILDFVPNHTSDQHPWFAESRSSRTNAKRDWYIWADPSPDGGPPNNWLSRFGGSAWEWDAATEQFYYHAFLREQPDLNWRNPEVRAAMAEVLRFWLRHGVDGFRIDAAAVLAEDELLRDDPPNPEADDSTPPPERQKRVWTNYRPEVLPWLADLRAVVDDFSDRVLLGEVDTSGDHIADFYGSPDRPILHLPLNYRLLNTSWKASELAEMIDAYLGILPPHAWPCWVIGSHDMRRVASRIGDRQARIAALLLLTLPGTPVLYAGDEIGMASVPIPQARSRDPFEREVPGYGLNRDPERTPMQWDRSDNAGFTTGDPWLPVGDDYPRRNVAVQRAASDSILQLYRRLIGLRDAEPALAHGAYQPLLPDGPILAYQRSDGERRLVVVANLSSDAQTFRLGGSGSGTVLLSTYLDRDGGVSLEQLRLRPDEGVVVALA